MYILMTYEWAWLNSNDYIIEWWAQLEQKILRDKLSKVLFHGTLMDRAANIVLDGIDFSKLNDRADFGKGFYVTDSYALAENTAKLRYHQELITRIKLQINYKKRSLIKFHFIMGDLLSLVYALWIMIYY